MKSQDLKNSILQMAMEGKLVPQDPNDEPASVLLERIKEEKERLIKEKKIKRNNKESVIFRKNNHFYEKIGKKGEEVCIDEEIPWEIPDNWELCRLNVVNNIFTGNSINKTEKENKFTGLTNGFNYIATKDVDFNNTINYENGVKIPEGLEKFRIAESGSVLLCIEGGSAGRKIAITDQDVCFGNKLCCFISYGISNKFLYYFLQSPIFKEVFKSETSGIIGGVGVGKIRNFFIPIPSIEEQQRIVKKLEDVIPYIDRYGIYEENLQKLNNHFPTKMKDSILQEAIQGKLVPQDPDDEPASVLLEKIRAEKERLVEEKIIKKNKNESFIFKENNHFYEKIGNKEPVCIDNEIPFDIPDTWEWSRLNSFCNIIMGQSPKGEFIVESDEGMEFHQGKIFFGEKFLEKSNKATINPSKISPPNSILLCVRAPVGKINLSDREICVGRGLASLKPYIAVCLSYLYYALLNYEDEFTKKATGSTFKAITKSVVENQLIPIPPQEEQKRIVQKIEELLLILNSV